MSASSSRNKGGTGLGLAIVKHILNRHEGRLEIVSTPGEGSAFTVWLPRAEGAAPRPRRWRPQDGPRPPSAADAARSAVATRRSGIVMIPSLRNVTPLWCCGRIPRRCRTRGADPWLKDESMAHIVASFDEDLVQVQARISEMGGLCEELLSKALESVQTRDAALAREVIERDRALDAMETALEEAVVKIIALRQPVAGDLRVLIAALKIASTLERIGDLAKNIAKRAIPLSSARRSSSPPRSCAWARRHSTQLSDVLNAHASRDVDLAIQIWNQDYEIDEMYNAIFREVVTYMVEDSRLIGVGAQLMFIAKNLERIGDHTTHISEMIYYIVTGQLAGRRPAQGRAHRRRLRPRMSTDGRTAMSAKVLVVEDEEPISRSWPTTSTRRASPSPSPPTATRRCSPSRRAGPTSCCSTGCCPTSRGSSFAGRSAPVATPATSR